MKNNSKALKQGKDAKRAEAETLDERLNEEFGPGKFAAMSLFARVLESSDTAQEKTTE